MTADEIRLLRDKQGVIRDQLVGGAPKASSSGKKGK